MAWSTEDCRLLAQGPRSKAGKLNWNQCSLSLLICLPIQRVKYSWRNQRLPLIEVSECSEHFHTWPGSSLHHRKYLKWSSTKSSSTRALQLKSELRSALWSNADSVRYCSRRLRVWAHIKWWSLWFQFFAPEARFSSESAQKVKHRVMLTLTASSRI